MPALRPRTDRIGQNGRTWRTAVLALAALPLSLGAAPPLPPKPQRIMSLMQCTDLMLLALVPRERIGSVTYLAHEAVQAILPGRDRGIAINHGTAEEILRLKPDLILAGSFATPAARRLAKQVGARVIEIGPVDSFADIRATTRTVGRAVGEPARAEAMIARMDATLRELAATRPVRTVTVAAWSGSGSVPGRGTLTDEIIRAAGGSNVAARRADAGYGSFDVEQLLAARPDAILQGEGSWRRPSLNAARAAHPLVRRLYASRRITYPEPLYACGLPQTAEAARDLRQALLAVPPGGVRW
jgi:iron complex transport system substrate-binding protein